MAQHAGLKNPVAEALLKAVKKDLSATELDFLRGYYQRLSGQDYQPDRAPWLRDCALHHYKLACKRRARQVLIEVATPKQSSPAPHTLVSIVAEDRPFLLNSLLIRLHALAGPPRRINHPMFFVRRHADGRLKALYPFTSDLTSPPADTRAEIFIQFELDYLLPKEHKRIKASLRDTIDRLTRITQDWQGMQKTAQTISKTLNKMVSKRGKAADLHEDAALLDWIREDHFVFIGSCTLLRKRNRWQLAGDSVLGFLRALMDEAANKKAGEAEVLDLLPPPPDKLRSGLTFTLSRRRPGMYRDTFFDCVLVNTDPGGGERPAEVHVLIGFIGRSAGHLTTQEIPRLRQQSAFILKQSNLHTGGYAYKALHSLIEDLPRQMLFQGDMHSLFTMCMSILNQKERRNSRVFLQPNPCGHFYNCLVYVPRDLFHSDLRERIQRHLQQAFSASEVTFNVYFSESILTRIHYIVHCKPGARVPAPAKLEQQIQAIALDWNDQLRATLGKRHDLATLKQLMHEFGDAFPASYRNDHGIDQAVADIEVLLSTPDGIAARLTRPADRPNAHLRLYHAERKLILSDVLPLLENSGLCVLTERSYPVNTATQAEYWVQDFELRRSDGADLDPAFAAPFEELLIRTLQGVNENDGFNQLTLLSGLDWREVSLFRAVYHYLKQVRLRYSEHYVISALRRHPELAKTLLDLFITRHHPDRGSLKHPALTDQFADQLSMVATLDEERIFGAYRDVIHAIMRTNYYQTDGDGEAFPYLSFKLASPEIPRLPKPLPHCEIFIYSPRFAGVHLRGGPVARGGIRWSDRSEDFRTEVLGLVKAQRVKNAVIVPVGAKGGFVPHQLPADRAGAQAEALACYRLFIGALLGLTDNLIDGRIQPPPQVIRHDGDDPYLVVAADKGTATFSDTANDLAEGAGFWLGDAFASGGSAGYDHKKMGITARGAWESVKRHFRELGKDTQTEPFTVVGIGDMGGDVFGNGMLLSPHIRLIGAFNHMHIFLDPNPDPARSFTERERLFKSGSGWGDYDTGCLSQGGAIYRRDAKSVDLSKQARERLGTEDPRCTPDELIRMLLQAEVELLWNGGIGTYIKASTETQGEAHDRANDAIRMDGCELNCKVIGEGGNLGATQQGRIEFAAKGGLCYTDAIDNSAGVNSSDCEVNIKILLGLAIRRKQLTAKARNPLLRKMTDEVARLVLANNYAQTRILNLESHRDHLREHAEAIDILEKDGLLDRAEEGLPDAGETEKRLRQQHNFTRPELAVLLSYSKMHLYQQLLQSDLPDQAELKPLLVDYFPTPLRKTYAKLMDEHPLRREIICTQLTNQLIDTLGPTFHLHATSLQSGTVEMTAKAYLVAAALLDTPALTEQIALEAGNLDAACERALLEALASGLGGAVFYLLRNAPLTQSIGELNARYQAILPILRRNNAAPEEWVQAHVSPTLASRIALLRHAGATLQLIDTANEAKRPVAEILQISQACAKHLDIPWVEGALSRLATDNLWQEKARDALRQDLAAGLASLSRRLSESRPPRQPLAAYLDQWRRRTDPAKTAYLDTKASLEQAEYADFAMLSVLVDELMHLH